MTDKDFVQLTKDSIAKLVKCIESLSSTDHHHTMAISQTNINLQLLAESIKLTVDGFIELKNRVNAMENNVKSLIETQKAPHLRYISDN